MCFKKLLRTNAWYYHPKCSKWPMPRVMTLMTLVITPQPTTLADTEMLRMQRGCCYFGKIWLAKIQNIADVYYIYLYALSYWYRRKEIQWEEVSAARALPVVWYLFFVNFLTLLKLPNSLVFAQCLMLLDLVFKFPSSTFAWLVMPSLSRAWPVWLIPESLYCLVFFLKFAFQAPIRFIYNWKEAYL